MVDYMGSSDGQGEQCVLVNIKQLCEHYRGLC